ncbi:MULTISPECIES: hypothetical protein [Clostridium]|jgi:hypothetical protein|uniref:Uncharacterized protein n=3 Tax=Clostridium butyricum TaxID=1492 RepID=C4IBG0_CLOBU|nr:MULTISPECIES: hypothetical protein [Clostridium]ALR90704.1 hypothetical protein ATN24_19930 [Clostridium butyricum]ALS18940.1 hypothetical protein ATD26_18875 [Clostridium butyricum]ANF16127.1 hypothetical protein AZ909_18910 [Clostridium butyricum]AOR96039.1 hypothetical protein BBB49_18380 [Clostridium butyricum]APF21125.1 hypothetical protein NPD4_4221 [Clostridium butyricum]
MDSCNCYNNIQPTLTNEENAGFRQARCGIRYSATVNNHDCKGNNSFFILYNPLHSMKDIYLVSVVHTNTSTSSVVVNAYCNCNDTLPPNIARLNSISNNNTSYCDDPCAAQLYSGHNIGFVKNTPLLIYAVKSNENFVNTINGGIILCPGSYYLEVTKGFADSGDGRQYSSISWWEQPICCRQ